jgi:hypothetical protein
MSEPQLDVNEFYQLKSQYYDMKKKQMNKIIKLKDYASSTDKKKFMMKKLSSDDNLKALKKKIDTMKKPNKMYNLEELLGTQFAKIEELKDEIIKLKLDLLFSYKTEDDVLKDITSKIQDFNLQLKLYKEYEVKINDIKNKNQSNGVLQLQIDIKTFIEEIKTLFENMNMKEAIQVYAESLQFGMPNTATTKLMNVKYAHCEMYKMDDDDEESYLIQLPHTMNQMEIKHNNSFK